MNTIGIVPMSVFESSPWPPSSDRLDVRADAGVQYECMETTLGFEAALHARTRCKEFDQRSSALTPTAMSGRGLQRALVIVYEPLDALRSELMG